MAFGAEWAKSEYEQDGPSGLIAQLEDAATLELIESLDAAMRHAYWGWNDMRGMMELAAPVLELAQESEDMEVLAKCKPVVANLAIWTWPGWGEPERKPTPEMVAWGAEAAKANLDLVHRLEKPPIALSRALWVVAAHRMLLDLEQAAEEFEEAADHAREAEADIEVQMNLCYALACRQDDSLPSELASLSMMGEDGQFYASQIEKAIEVLKL